MKQRFFSVNAVPFILFFVVFQLYGSFAGGQDWQWGIRGGSGNSVVSRLQHEKVLDMAADVNGNIYFLAHAQNPGLDMAGQALAGYGGGDVIFGSLDCAGNIRWVKVIGGAGEDVPNSSFHAVNTDLLGHVYVAGYMSNAPTFSTDTLHPSTGKRLFLVQYDTSGNFQWLRMPQPDTVSQTYTNRYRFLDMDVDAQGNVYYFGTFNEGQLAGTSTTLPVLGPYILKYDAQGNMVDVITLDMGVPFGTNITGKIARDPSNGRFYIAGQYNSGSFSINGQSITKPAYAAAFDNQGQHLWTQINTNAVGAGFVARPVLDASGNVYLGGYAQHGDVFNGYTVVNSLTTIPHGIPLVVKLNSNGALQWGKNASSTGGCGIYAVTLRSNGDVVVAGSYGRLVMDNDTLWHAPNQGYDVFLATLNSQTAALISLDSIGSVFGSTDHPGAIASDANGNIYVGGEYGAQLYVGQDTLLSFGGQTDFFVAKYGYPCGCTPPTGSFSFTANGSTPQINFLYTGTSNVDSMRWTFGDGNGAATVNPTHLYPGNGTYTACVKVYNACGVDSSCQTITINCPVPVPSFSFMYAGDTVLFSYTGTTADSVHWDFGDGQSATGSSPSHHYAGDGTYTVCATAYNGCGSEDTCMTVVIMGVEDVNGRAAITVFPNPAKEYLQVEGLRSSCSYKLYNVVGSIVQEGVIEANTGRIDLQQLPAGTYLLELRGEDSVMRVKVLKE